MRLDSEVALGRIIYKPNPEYPPLAKAARIQGKVLLEALIGKDGTVEELNVLSGHPMLVKSAMEAVRQWRYQPTRVKAEPVEVITEIDINFTLEP
jgi:protein TonB